MKYLWNIDHVVCFRLDVNVMNTQICTYIAEQCIQLSGRRMLFRWVNCICIAEPKAKGMGPGDDHGMKEGVGRK